MNKYAIIRDLAIAAVKAEATGWPTGSFKTLIIKALDSKLRDADALDLRRDWGGDDYMWAAVQGLFYDIIDQPESDIVSPNAVSNAWDNVLREEGAADGANALLEGFVWALDERGSYYWDEVHVKLSVMANGRSGAVVGSRERAMAELAVFIAGGFPWSDHGGGSYWGDVHSNITRVCSEIDWDSESTRPPL